MNLLCGIVIFTVLEFIYLVQNVNLYSFKCNWICINYGIMFKQTCFTDFQPLHGSPYHVYPINNHPPAIQAFQAPNTASLYNVSTSPLLTNKLQKMVSNQHDTHFVHLPWLFKMSNDLSFGYFPSILRKYHLLC